MTPSSSARTQAVALSIAGIGLVLAGASLWLFVSAQSPASESSVLDLSVIPARVEFAAPAVKLRDLSGKESALDDSLGKVVLVNLWATWCPPCKAEMPTLQKFHDEHFGQGFTVVAINDGESDAVVRRFVNERGLTIPVWLDPNYLATEVAFRAANLPTSYVIDRAGVVRLMWVGAIDESALEQYVLPLIEE
jgi:cytochrome c biogenesis protein CcmG, thiol:disulfide interchange protein DsbE